MIYKKYAKSYYIFKANKPRFNSTLSKRLVFNLDSRGKLNQWIVLTNHLELD